MFCVFDSIRWELNFFLQCWHYTSLLLLLLARSHSYRPGLGDGSRLQSWQLFALLHHFDESGLLRLGNPSLLIVTCGHSLEILVEIWVPNTCVRLRLLPFLFFTIIFIYDVQFVALINEFMLKQRQQGSIALLLLGRCSILFDLSWRLATLFLAHIDSSVLSLHHRLG